MYFFDRKTMYFVWHREDGQAKGVGSAQLTVVENVCRIEVSVTNCGRVEGSYPCCVLSGPVESLIGMLHLSRGKGTLSLRCDADRIGDARLPYGKLTGIRIDLKEQGYLEQRWLPLYPHDDRKAEAEADPGVLGMDEAKAEPGVLGTDEAKAEPGVLEMMEEKTEPGVLGMREAKTEPGIPGRTLESKTEVDEQETTEAEESCEQGMAATAAEPGRKRPVRLYPDKWQQLCAIYPVVHPFGDARGYLSIEPRDFVILREQYQTMVQNSFLLHGFYNYRHLLLGRQRGEKEMNYYLGVPGVFYEKERSAALFYGFEGFESAKTPAREGSFGYYMKKVQI